MKKPNVICQQCNIEFYKSETEQRKTKRNFCSKDCFNKFQFIQVQVECKKCNRTFHKRQSEIKKTPNNFCSKSCAASYNNTHKKYGTRRSKLEIYLEEQIKAHYPDLELVCNQKSAIESELDFYFPELRFAIELNGITHYEPIYGEDKFEKIQNNDKRKIIACYEKDIELAIIDSSSCSYLNEAAKNKFKILVFDLLEKVKNRKPSNQ